MKKAFTLIELLAVIAIIAIVGLITSPMISDILENSEKGAFEDSVQGIIKAIDIDKANGGFNINRVYTMTNGVIAPDIDYKNSFDGSGVIKLDEDGNISVVIQYDKWCATKDYNSKAVTVKIETCVFNSDTSLANEPYLMTNMVPIKWDGTKWIRADSRNPSTNKWYDYNLVQWANVALVKEVGSNTRKYYLSDDALGVEVREIDILAYFVWIPRYNYAISSGVGARTISINFEEGIPDHATGNAVDANYLTHPAFIFGTRELTGFWFGKFETTGTLSSITVKPNLAALTNNQLLSTYISMDNIYDTNNVYGLPKASADARISKNIEWAAVSYLTQSIYGVNSQLWKNNSTTYITGCAGSSVTAAGSAGCANAYTTTNGLKASSTGNIYGVYDMAGGTNEVVMANYKKTAAESGITSFPNAKYFDQYTTGVTTTACFNLSCYGHGLYEVSGWYSGLNTFVNYTYPWVIRGSNSTSAISSQYEYNYYDGAASTSVGFRLTLSSK